MTITNTPHHRRYFPGCTHAQAAAARAAALAATPLDTGAATPPLHLRSASPPASPDVCDNSPAAMTSVFVHVSLFPLGSVYLAIGLQEWTFIFRGIRFGFV